MVHLLAMPLSRLRCTVREQTLTINGKEIDLTNIMFYFGYETFGFVLACILI